MSFARLCCRCAQPCPLNSSTCGPRRGHQRWGDGCICLLLLGTLESGPVVSGSRAKLVRLLSWSLRLAGVTDIRVGKPPEDGKHSVWNAERRELLSLPSSCGCECPTGQQGRQLSSDDGLLMAAVRAKYWARCRFSALPLLEFPVYCKCFSLPSLPKPHPSPA